MARFRAALIAVAASSGAFLVTACSEDDSAPQPQETAQPSTGGSSKRGRGWMPVNSKLTPAQWLASHGAAEVKPANDPSVQKLARDLEAAHLRYRESERMIANRAAQLEDMLRELGVEESAEHILEDLARLAGEVGQTEGFGAISQHYYNLRANRMDRAAALARLQERYGKRK